MFLPAGISILIVERRHSWKTVIYRMLNDIRKVPEAMRVQEKRNCFQEGISRKIP